MRNFIFLLVLFYAACTLPEEKKANQLPQKQVTTVIKTDDTNTATLDTSNSIRLPVIQKMRLPSGIYQTVSPLNDKLEQTIAFNSDLSYQLQEKYIEEGKDSIVITYGTWTPSDGFIWLYKDQVMRGRYKWKDNTLQYVSAFMKKNFPMRHLADASQNLAWKNKPKAGIILFGTGTEPFWNIELDNKDSLSFLLADWKHSLRMKVDSVFKENEANNYFAQNDSTQILVTVFPHFCTDGMSDFTYRNKVKVQFNQQVFNGCGIVYKLQ